MHLLLRRRGKRTTEGERRECRPEGGFFSLHLILGYCCFHFRPVCTYEQPHSDDGVLSFFATVLVLYNKLSVSGTCSPESDGN